MEIWAGFIAGFFSGFIVTGFAACCIIVKMDKKINCMRRRMREFESGVQEARRIWMEENCPQDGTDCVTPFDHFLYRRK